MATYQTSNQRNKLGNSRNQGGQPARRPNVEIEESTSSYGAIGDMAEQASDYVTQGAAEVQECIREHSGASIAVTLVAGFGVGLLIGRALGTPHRQPRSWRERLTAEGVGRRLLDRIEAMLPEALAEHFGK
jgi:hypothetical protein